MSDDNSEAATGCGCLILLVVIGAAVANQESCNSSMTQDRRMRSEQKFVTDKKSEVTRDEVFEEVQVLESVYDLVPADQVNADGPEPFGDSASPPRPESIGGSLPESSAP